MDIKHLNVVFIVNCSDRRQHAPNTLLFVLKGLPVGSTVQGPRSGRPPAPQKTRPASPG